MGISVQPPLGPEGVRTFHGGDAPINASLLFIAQYACLFSQLTSVFFVVNRKGKLSIVFSSEFPLCVYPQFGKKE